MIRDLYYTGESIPLSFRITAGTSVQLGNSKPFSINMDESSGVKLTKINVSVVNKEGELVREDPVTVVDNVVSYTLAPELTKHAGDYAAFFDMEFEGGRKKVYKMPFAVLPWSMSREGKSSKLNRQSEDIEIETALGQDIRANRKKSKPAQEAYNVAQEKLGRRLEK